MNNNLKDFKASFVEKGRETGDSDSSTDLAISSTNSLFSEKDKDREIVNTDTGKENLNSYKNIIKGSSFFGGVQIFNILITLIRGKFVAIILGPEGMGITALFNSASNTIQRFASLGLNQSIVRDVAEDSAEIHHKENVIKASLRITNITAFLGMLICIAFCLPLSRVTFGNESYWWQFMILGVGIFFAIAGTGKLSILQGLHEVKKISKASVVGGLTGLGVGIPLYYLFGYNGIVPAIVTIFLALYIFYSASLHKSYKFSFPTERWSIYFPIIKKLMSLGVVLMAGDLIATLVGYLINLYIRMMGGVDDVGLYQAANSVTNQYTGVIFAALAMDYFPRLSKVSNDNEKMTAAVNRQSEVVAWLITPALVALILSTPLVIRVLLSESFHSIVPLMRWLGLGMMLRAFSFPMAYITFAKGNKRVFFIMEGIVCNALTLVISCLFFHWFGLIGLGYALVADNALCFLIYYGVNHKLYDYRFSKASSLNFLIGALFTGSCFVFSFFESSALSYSLMGVGCVLSLVWSFISLRSHFKK